MNARNALVLNVTFILMAFVSVTAADRHGGATIVQRDSGGNPTVAITFDTIVGAHSPLDGGAVMDNVSSIELFDQDAGVIERPGTACGLEGRHTCYAFSSGDSTVLFIQAPGLPDPRVDYGLDSWLIQPNGNAGSANNTQLQAVDFSERTCSLCAWYYNRCGDFQTWDCVPGNCSSCTVCRSRPC